MPINNQLVMKIKVKPEGRPEIYLPDRESLKKWIKSKKFKEIHNFISSDTPMIIGADHDVESVLKDIDIAERVAVLIGEAKKGNFNHALACIINNYLEMYDIGEVTEKDLEVEDDN